MFIAKYVQKYYHMIYNYFFHGLYRNKTMVISKSFHPHVVHVYKQSMHNIGVKPSSCHTWLVKEAHVWTKCDLVESCDKMTKICHIFNTWSWPLYLSTICWWKDNKISHFQNQLLNSVWKLTQIFQVHLGPWTCYHGYQNNNQSTI